MSKTARELINEFDAAFPVVEPPTAADRPIIEQAAAGRDDIDLLAEIILGGAA